MKLPNLPEKEELEFKEKEFFFSLHEQFESSAKIWFYLLLVVVILAWPGTILLRANLAGLFISRYQPPEVNLHPYTPLDLKILKTQVLPVTAGIFSAYAQVLNPNLDISSQLFHYQFVFKDASGAEMKKVLGTNYLLAGESKFLLAPTVTTSPAPQSVEFLIGKTEWTKRRPDIDVKLDILQKNTGTTPEGKFFVEGLLKNLQSLQIKKVELTALVFDQTNQNVVAVNSSVYTDLVPLESRYFRLVWPVARFPSQGEVQVIPSLNRLDPGVVLGKPNKIPVR